MTEQYKAKILVVLTLKWIEKLILKSQFTKKD